MLRLVLTPADIYSIKEVLNGYVYFTGRRVWRGFYRVNSLGYFYKIYRLGVDNSNICAIMRA